MRSPEAYERLRDNVKGPEDLEKEMRKAEQLAEFHFALEAEPQAQGMVYERMREDIGTHGIDAVLDAEEAPPSVRAAMQQGNFSVAVEPHPATHEDAVHALPEGNVQERLPVKTSFSDRYIAQVLSAGGGKPKS